MSHVLLKCGLVRNQVSFFFFCVQGSNFRPCIYHALSLPTELSLRGHESSVYVSGGKYQENVMSECVHVMLYHSS